MERKYWTFVAFNPMVEDFEVYFVSSVKNDVLIFQEEFKSRYTEPFKPPTHTIIHYTQQELQYMIALGFLKFLFKPIARLAGITRDPWGGSVTLDAGPARGIIIAKKMPFLGDSNVFSFAFDEVVWEYHKDGPQFVKFYPKMDIVYPIQVGDFVQVEDFTGVKFAAEVLYIGELK